MFVISKSWGGGAVSHRPAKHRAAETCGRRLTDHGGQRASAKRPSAEQLCPGEEAQARPPPPFDGDGATCTGYTFLYE